MDDFPFIAIRSVDLGVPDMERAEAFYTRTWGLRVCARYGKIVYLRATGTLQKKIGFSSCGEL